MGDVFDRGPDGSLFYGGLRIVTDINLVDVVEDWSSVRSPALELPAIEPKRKRK